MAFGTRPPSPPASASCAERRARPRLALLCAALACGCDSCESYDDVCDPTASSSSIGGIWTISGQGERAGCADPRNNGAFELGPSTKLAVDMVSEAVDSGPREAAAVDVGTRDLTPREAGPREAGPREARPRDAAPREAKTSDATVKDGPRDGTVKDGAQKAGDATARDGASDRRAQDGPRDARRDLRRDARRPTPSYRYVLRLRSAPPGFALFGQVQGSCVTFTTSETDLLGTILYEFRGKVSSSRVKGRFTGTGPTGCHASGTFTVEYR